MKIVGVVLPARNLCPSNPVIAGLEGHQGNDKDILGQPALQHPALTQFG
jgi:hypothetical protein